MNVGGHVWPQQGDQYGHGNAFDKKYTQGSAGLEADTVVARFAQMVTGISHFDVHKSFSMTIRVDMQQ